MSEFAPCHPSPLRQVRNRSSTSTSPDSTAVDSSDYDADAESVGVERVERIEQLVHELTLDTHAGSEDQTNDSSCQAATNRGQETAHLGDHHHHHHQETPPLDRPGSEPSGELPPLPSDVAEETHRLETCHAVWRILLCGALYRAPVVYPRAVLSVGAGLGRWASELVAEFPLAEVIGIDAGPTFVPTPPNVVLYMHGTERDWDTIPFGKEKRFDLIHGRMLAGRIQDWPRFFRQAMQRLRPGGWLELNEFQFDVFSLGVGDSGRLEQRIRSMARRYREAGEMGGLHAQCGAMDERNDVHCGVFECASGGT